jgi:LysR family transcriptional regulator (chromosome initiation inhibitor)
LNGDELNFHIVPSIRGFKKYALLGYGYGLIPKIDILKELKKKELVQLDKNKIWTIPLYWHYWDIQSKFYKKFNADIIHHAKNKLNPRLLPIFPLAP